ncbi:MAG: amidohydrolase family protein, partial [Firmicutes bacterium]|nr:amidohydrolase family protein [Bacillota bacterium]
DEAIATARDWQAKYGGEHIRCNTIKFFIDGTNELGDCCSLVPFANDPTGTYCGSSYATEDEMTEVMLKINDAGMDFHVHTICDGAFRLMCNAYERAKAQRPDSWNMYLTLAHCELIDPEDMHRVARLGIFIDWSTHWSGGYFGEVAREYLGDRWYRMYDFTTIIREGGIVGYSSDVFTYQEAIRANPFIGMQTAMTRVDMFLPLDPEKYPGSVRPPETAKLPLTDLLRGYTYNNALRMRLLDRMGTIETGKLANLVVLNKDIFKTPAEEIAGVDAELVIYEGQARRITSSLQVARG